MYQITRLPSGLVVATTEMPHRASVSLGLWVGVGGRYEPAELNGVSHFIEHLLFKGTPKRSAKEISQAVEGIGGGPQHLFRRQKKRVLFQGGVRKFLQIDCLGGGGVFSLIDHPGGERRQNKSTQRKRGG